MRDPIDPADIRVGDRVERVYVSGDHETIERFTVESLAHRAVSSCRLSWGIDSPRTGIAEWFLLDRPDPLAEVVEVVARAQWRFYEAGDPDVDVDVDSGGDEVAYLSVAHRIIAAIAERWELVERVKP